MLFEPDTTDDPDVTAAEARRYLSLLEAERSLAVGSGLADVESYMSDLDEELEHWRWRYVATAVTEIAELRAEVSGPLLG